MIETSVGLPNSCCVCGVPQVGTWYAENEDVARSGGGMCYEDTFGATPMPKSANEIAPLTDLWLVDGVGPATATKLRKVNINTIQSLASCEAEALAKAMHIGSVKASKMIESAREILIKGAQ